MDGVFQQNFCDVWYISINVWSYWYKSFFPTRWMEVIRSATCSTSRSLPSTRKDLYWWFLHLILSWVKISTAQTPGKTLPAAQADTNYYLWLLTQTPLRGLPSSPYYYTFHTISVWLAKTVCSHPQCNSMCNFSICPCQPGAPHCVIFFFHQSERKGVPERGRRIWIPLASLSPSTPLFHWYLACAL